MQPDELRAARKALGLSQAELGLELGLTGEFIGMMERGVKAIERRTDLAMRYLVLMGASATKDAAA